MNGTGAGQILAPTADMEEKEMLHWRRKLEFVLLASLVALAAFGGMGWTWR
jgi:hypothetical protein